MARFDYPQPSRPRKRSDGIRSLTKRGAFVEHWWAERWIQALERITDAGRLRRGRAYARQGQVLSVEEQKGAIQARVQGSRATPYRVQIQLQPLSDAQWQAVVDALAERAIFTAQLLANEMPQEIEEAFTAAGVSLFPDHSSALETSCSCPDWANPCKHVAATHYILGEQFDVDPFLLFRLRGRDQEQILSELRARRQTPTAVGEETADYQLAAKDAPPLSELLESFWQPGESLEHFPTLVQAPSTPHPLLRRLGPPPFLSDSQLKQLATAYDAITQEALKTAYSAADDAAPAEE